MKACGIIAEYDPFHAGHAWQMQEARRLSGCDAVVCVMSCTFTQRGMPAMFSPHTRAEMALKAGADIVLGLPFSYSVCDAERFALGGLHILKQFNCVNFLSFGIEPGIEKHLTDAAILLENPDESFRTLLHGFLNAGLSFPKAQGLALSQRLSLPETAFSQPNAALALCYARINLRMGSPFALYPVQRRGDYHDESFPSKGFASASAIRKALLNNDFDLVRTGLPESSFSVVQDALNRGDYHLPDALSPLLRWKIRTTADFSHLPSLSEGIENLLPCAASFLTRDSMVLSMKSKRYSYARLNRLLTHVLMDTDAEKLSSVPAYAYVLGFRKGFSSILRSAADLGFPLLSSLSRDEKDAERLLDARAFDLWSLGVNQPFGALYRAKPVIFD